MTLFCDIIDGRLPASWVHRDEWCVAFMDINPMSPGHVLVVPRLAVATLAELPSAQRAHALDVAVRIGRAQQQALGSRAQHLLVNDGKAASQTVPHVHLHVIPRYGRDSVSTMARMVRHVVTLMLPTRVSAAKRAALDAQAALLRAALAAQD